MLVGRHEMMNKTSIRALEEDLNYLLRLANHFYTEVRAGAHASFKVRRINALQSFWDDHRQRRIAAHGHDPDYLSVREHYAAISRTISEARRQFRSGEFRHSPEVLARQVLESLGTLCGGETSSSSYAAAA